ncbi:MAG: hypothetical protein VX700_00755 [Pseudomonadota bacterium]|nr:hypothetical protein [Pseudomonadota bacterium]
MKLANCRMVAGHCSFECAWDQSLGCMKMLAATILQKKAGDVHKISPDATAVRAIN